LIEAGVTLALDLAEGLPPVAADKVQVQQVVLNLVTNASQAVAAMSPERRDIVISTRRGGEGEVVTSVQDRGPGFSTSDLAKPFEPFHSTKAGGMGLGLSISRTLVEAHGGRIWAENNARGGATVSFTLPVVSAAGE
jgi:signal transduction histidine kinase